MVRKCGAGARCAFLTVQFPSWRSTHVSSRCVGPTGRKLRGPENVEEVELEKEKEKGKEKKKEKKEKKDTDES